MKVKNGNCIRRLGFRQMLAAKSRNIIAVFAVALTTLLFTALFTIAQSVTASSEEYNFRQAGGYSHGAFKEVNEEQLAALAAHPEVKEYGVRKVCGIIADGAFAKQTAEVSFMDTNTAKWSYAFPSVGRMPESGMEIAMDREALAKLGVAPELGAQVELAFLAGDSPATGVLREDTFTLVGFWEYDALIPVHFINVSRDYADRVEADYLAAGGEGFRMDMNVMLASAADIRGRMERIDTDLGFQWEDRERDDCVRIGVNWGYAGAGVDPASVLAIAAFLVLVVFTGYLIIYNIFQISVTNDIQFYGLLKTIGTTPRQLRRIVRMQALCLSAVGIPIGWLAGFLVGSVLAPLALENTFMGKNGVFRLGISPLVFAGAALFSLLTVLLSCARPCRTVSKITPIEAVRFSEGSAGRGGERRSADAGIGKMAFHNLGRNRVKTALVTISLALAVVLLNSVVMLVSGFDGEKYLARFSDMDFLVGTTGYFNDHMFGGAFGLEDSAVEEIAANVNASLCGSVYCEDNSICNITCWISEEAYRGSQILPAGMPGAESEEPDRRGDLIEEMLVVEGFDESLFGKLRVREGDIAPLADPAQNAIAIAVREDENGEWSAPAAVGDKLTVTYTDRAWYDLRTGEPADYATPEEYIDFHMETHDVEYTVCALVEVPYSMSYRAWVAGSVEAVLSSRELGKNVADMRRMFFACDVPDGAEEKAAEDFLAEYTGNSFELMYESKAVLRAEFEQYGRMFLTVGGVLCAVIALVGVLNFFNSVLTGIMTRRREFAMLQSVGMTGRQLKRMLIYEGVFYALAAGVLSLALALLVNPLAGAGFAGAWFLSYRFTILPVFAVLPVFLLIGALLPPVVYRFAEKQSIVERLRMV